MDLVVEEYKIRNHLVTRELTTISLCEVRFFGLNENSDLTFDKRWQGGSMSQAQRPAQPTGTGPGACVVGSCIAD
jgi:hypothetical protein